MFTKEQAFFLGISEKENKILNNLSEEPKSIFVLSKKTKIPRTTLYPIITKLYKRELVQCKEFGERFLYQSTPPGVLYKKIFDLAESIKPKPTHITPKIDAQISLKDHTPVPGKKQSIWFRSLFK